MILCWKTIMLILITIMNHVEALVPNFDGTIVE